VTEHEVKGRKRRYLSMDVVQKGVQRLTELHRNGARLVVSSSGGKDSTVITELAIMAARECDALPVDVVTLDEEIMYPGTFEYLERLAERPEVRMNWLVARMPVANIFNRAEPLWWTFDPELDSSEWTREPPWKYVTEIERQSIAHKIDKTMYPTEGELFSVTGIRGAESPTRIRSIGSAARGSGRYDLAHLTKVNAHGVRTVRPIYDWEDGDVWKFIGDNGLDYNRAYDTMLRMGIGRHRMRIGPPTQRLAEISKLQMASKAWPGWFDKVCNRLGGIRTAAQFGTSAVTPDRRAGESYADAYERQVTGPGNPDWIRERGQRVLDYLRAKHGEHSTGDIPDAADCPLCPNFTKGPQSATCYRSILKLMYLGDPLANRQGVVGLMQPSYWRPGAADW